MKKHALIVEDHFINQELMKEILEPFGLAVDIAESKHRAIALVSNKAYDVVFVDLFLPDGSGLAVAEHIRKTDGEKKRTPIVAITASDISQKDLWFVNSTIDGYIAKPFTAGEIEDVLKTVY